MKKFFVAMIMVCLSIAFCSSAMAQDHRNNGHYKPTPAVVHYPAPAPVHHAGTLPPPPPRHAHPAPPRVQYYARPLPPRRHAGRLRPRVGVSIGRRVGLSVGVGPVGIHIPL